MQFKLAVSDLARAAQRCALVAGSNSVLSVLDSALITVKKDHAWFMATNLETTLNTRIPCESTDEFAFVFEVKAIKELCALLPEHPVTIIYDQASKALTVVTDLGEYTYSSQGAEMFPKQPEVNNNVTFKVNMDIVDKMNIATKFTSKDTLRPAMTGVSFEVQDDKLIVAATDAHSLYVSEPYEIPSTGETDSFVVPQKTILSIIETGFRGEVELSYNKTHIVFKTPDTEVYARLIDAIFPHYRQVIPVHEQKIVYEMKKLQQAVNLAALAASKTTNQITIHLDSGNCVVRAQDIDFSKAAKSPIEIKEQTCPDFAFSFNAAILQRILKQTVGNVTLLTSGKNTSAFIFKDESCEDIYLLMPLMITA